MGPSMNEQIEREFLHALATPMAVLKIVVHKVDDSIRKPELAVGPEKQLEWLERCKRSLEQLEQLHADHKLRVSGAK
jgi:hypothetical protein